MLRIAEHSALLWPDGRRLDATAIRHGVEILAAQFAAEIPEGGHVGLLADNSPDWVLVDLALSHAKRTMIPIPGFFTAAQCSGLLTGHGMTAVITDDHGARALGVGASCRLSGTSLSLALLSSLGSPSPWPSGTAKVTFTSGSTGSPKGIALSSARQTGVAEALSQRLHTLGLKRHLTMLPLAVLLENVAGVYTALLSGAEVMLPSLSDTGLSGSSSFDARKALEAIRRHEAQSIIVLPEMLRAMTAVLAREGGMPPTLKFLAVGGAKIPANWIDDARRMGLPAYEGYGLSEAASVVSLNTPAADRVGSVGRPLEPDALRIDASGEIMLRDSTGAWWGTGDLGTQDGDGYVSVVGRCKNLIITSFGRNISPEWPESLLIGQRDIMQAMVVGDGRPYLAALVVPVPGASSARIELAVAEVNRELPDYARIGAWREVPPFTPQMGLLTANGRPRRDAIEKCFGQVIEDMFTREEVV